MPTNRPDTTELLQALESFLSSSRRDPRIPPDRAFGLRIAANAAAIVRRELEQGPARDNRETTRLRTLLPQLEDPDLATLNSALTEAIRNGDIALDDPALRQHLRHSATDQLRIDNPRYSALSDD